MKVDSGRNGWCFGRLAQEFGGRRMWFRIGFGDVGWKTDLSSSRLWKGYRMEFRVLTRISLKPRVRGGAPGTSGIEIQRGSSRVAIADELGFGSARGSDAKRAVEETGFEGFGRDCDGDELEPGFEGLSRVSKTRDLKARIRRDSCTVDN